MQMQGRTFAARGVGEYRYGFNGKERDDEVKGAGNEIDYGMRVYDPRAGRFMSVDPLVSEYPYYTPYQYAGNKPIWYVDLDGLEEAIPKLQLSIPKLTNVSESTCIGCAQRNDFIHRAKDQDNEARLKDGYDAWISNPDNIGKSLPPQYSKFASQVVDQQHLGVGGYEATPEYKITK